MANKRKRDKWHGKRLPRQCRDCGADISTRRGPAVRCAACQAKFRRQVQSDYLRAKRRKPAAIREADGVMYEVVWNGRQTPEPAESAGERPAPTDEGEPTWATGATAQRL